MFFIILKSTLTPSTYQLGALSSTYRPKAGKNVQWTSGATLQTFPSPQNILTRLFPGWVTEFLEYIRKEKLTAIYIISRICIDYQFNTTKQGSSYQHHHLHII